MANVHVDVTVLHGALDAARIREDISWRELARKIGVSASTMSRLAQGQNPDVNAFAKMVRWLRIPADNFIVDGEGAADDGQTGSRSAPPALVAQLSPLLRARSDLEPEDIEFIEAVIESAVRRFNAERDKQTSKRVGSATAS
jgi:transcriptional regulator with XRE-family HTH domain